MDITRRFPVKVDPTVNCFVSQTDPSGFKTTGTVTDHGYFISSLNGDLASGYAQVDGAPRQLNGFAKYVTSTIPVGSTITAAVSYTRVTSNTSPARTGHAWGSCTIDPTTATATQIYNEGATNYWSQQPYRNPGSLNQTLNLAARTNIQNTLTQGWFAMLLYPTGNNWATGTWMQVKGDTGDQTIGGTNTRPYLAITYTEPAGCSGTPTGGTTVLTPNTGTHGSTFVGTVTGSSSGSGLSYQWQSAPASTGPWTDITGATAATYNGTAPFANGTIYYRRKITCSNGGASAYSTAVTFTTTCTPSHTQGNAPGGGYGYVGISNVNIGSINNTTGYQNPPPAYNYYSALSTDIGEGTSYSLKVTYNDDGGPPANRGKVGAWIDWNSDGDFDDANEYLGGLGNINDNTIINFTIIVPAGTALGTKRLRIRTVLNAESLASSDACTIKQFGETEDYSVKVIFPVICEPTSELPDALYIKSVAFVGTLSDPPANPSTYNATGFQNFTTLTSKAVQAQGEGINIIASVDGTIMGRGTWKAWVDWNKNNIFEPATEEVYNIYGFAGAEVTFGFVIPPATLPGDYRIRIRTNNGLDFFDYPSNLYETFGFDFSPCDPFKLFDPDPDVANFGETEDYLFTVVAKCNSLITEVTSGQNCGPGTVVLKAKATAGVTEFRWYDAKTGGTLKGTSLPSGVSTTFTTASISSTTSYYVTAWNGSCESQVRTLVSAKINATPVVSFTQTVPDFCGDNTVLRLTAGGDKEVVYLINENFESGTLGLFSNINSDSTDPLVKANTSWKNQSSTYVPTANVWFPAISSGFGANKFALAYSDSKDPNYPISTIENSLVLATAVNTNTFLNLTLTLKLFYSRYIPDGVIDPLEDEFVNIEISTDDGATYPNIIKSFTSDVEIGTRFKELSYDLSAFINNPNLKIRVRHRSFADPVTGWLPDGVGIDDVALFGEKPLGSSFNYDTSIIDAYTNVLCTPFYAYVSGTPATTIWLKPSATQLENNAMFTIPVSATLSNGCSATGSVSIANNSKIWNPGGSVTQWNDTSTWKPNVAIPDNTKCVVIKKEVILGAGLDGSAKNISIQPGGSLTIKKDQTLTVTDFVKNETTPLATNEANLVLESDANLIQINSGAPNFGRMTANRNVTGLRYQPGINVDYVYWSSPVFGQITKGTAPGAFSPGTPSNRFYYYRESNDRFYETGDPTFTLGRGYAVQAENNQGPTFTKDYTFKGTPNNGNINFGLVRSPDNPIVHGFNLVGNPYPSNINFEELFYGNSTLIWNTAYFWTNNVFEPTQMGQSYGGNNYAIYNGTGGNSATTAAGGTGITVKPNGIVKVGQGFIIQAKSSGTLNFKNDYGTGHQLRVGSAGTFFQKGLSEKNRYWIKLIAPSNLINSQLIGYVQGATNDYEQDYDAEAFGQSSDLFYSVLNDKKLLIQGRDQNFTDEDKVTLGANFFQSGSYTIALDHAEGIFASTQNIYLKDKQEGIVTNLSQGVYSFDAAKGDNSTRFEIIYKPEIVLVTDSELKEGIVVYRDHDNFVIQSPKLITRVEVYDASGKLITVLQPNKKQGILVASAITNGIYVLKITTTDGAVTNKKISR